VFDPTNLSADKLLPLRNLHWSDEYASSYTVKLKNLSNNQLQSFAPKVNFCTATGLASCTRIIQIESKMFVRSAYRFFFMVFL
jgi:hypothetical protein